MVNALASSGDSFANLRIFESAATSGFWRVQQPDGSTSLRTPLFSVPLSTIVYQLFYNSTGKRDEPWVLGICRMIAERWGHGRMSRCQAP